ncbi:MAG: hypothetical protein WC321_06555 [Candidatus Omnitrophota bacterium]|jgi:hypothetical protein
MAELFPGISFLDAVSVVLFWLSPLIFIFGLALLITSLAKYNKLESVLGREIGGIRKRVFPKIETNIYTLQQRLLESKIVIALVCIVCAFIFLFLLKK